MPNERMAPLQEDHASFKGWSACADAMHKYDENLVKGWKEEIDTLLLLAGLFSAVLTSFTVQSFQMLQPPSAQDAMLLHMHTILSHLSHLEGTSSSIPPTMPPPLPPPPVRVNLVWFAGLILSLIAALIGILVKQWLREYTSHQLTAPRDAVRLRQFRYVGLVRWRVSDIIATLPFLLQTSLVLFIVGLLDLLWSIVKNTLVAAVSSSIVGVFFVLVFTSVGLPLVFPDCPYKAPLALQLRAIVLFVHEALTRGLFSSSKSHYTSSIPHGWHEADTSYVHAQPKASLAVLEHSALTWAHRTVLSDTFQDALAPCVYDLPPHQRVHLAHALLGHVAGLSMGELLVQLRAGPQGANAALHHGLLRAGHGAILRLLTLVLDVLPDASYVDATLSRADLLLAIHPLLNAFVWTGKHQYSTRDATTRRVYDVLLDVLGYEGQTTMTLQAAFGLLMTFGHLFWKHIAFEDVARMLSAALSTNPPVGAPLPLYDTLVIAAPTVLHYTFALTPAQLAHLELRRQLYELQHLTAGHVRLRHSTRQPYLAAPPVRVSLAWELCRLAQRDPALIHLGLVRALVEGNHAGFLPPGENGPLAVTLDVLRKAGMDLPDLRPPCTPPLDASPPPTRPSPKMLLSPPKIHTRTRSRSKPEPHIATALVRSVLRTASSSSCTVVGSPVEHANLNVPHLPIYDEEEKSDSSVHTDFQPMDKLPSHTDPHVR